MDLQLITENNDEHGILKQKLDKIPKGLEREQLYELNLMVEIMKNNNGIGLTASQVNLNKKMFVMYVDYGLETEKIEYVINPVIMTRDRVKITEVEGCLSYPNKQVEVARPRMIRVQYHNGYRQIRTELRGLNARIFAHEVNHTKGQCPLGDI